MFKRQIQLCVFLDNRPGRFTEFCDQLYGHGLDILALNLHADSEVGILRMVVDKTDIAIKVLAEEGIPFQQAEVLVVEVPNQQGMAAGVGHRLAQADVNIEYAYFSGGAQEAPALMVFKVSNLDQAMASLQKSAQEYN
jgi:hypothetical protein